MAKRVVVAELLEELCVIVEDGCHYASRGRPPPCNPAISSINHLQLLGFFHPRVKPEQYSLVSPRLVQAPACA